MAAWKSNRQAARIVLVVRRIAIEVGRNCSARTSERTQNLEHRTEYEPERELRSENEEE
jgi:hypothetical protein